MHGPYNIKLKLTTYMKSTLEKDELRQYKLYTTDTVSNGLHPRFTRQSTIRYIKTNPNTHREFRLYSSHVTEKYSH